MAAKKKKTAVEEVFEVEQENSLGIITGSDQIVQGGVPRRCKQVAIVGFAPSSMRDVRFLFGRNINI